MRIPPAAAEYPVISGVPLTPNLISGMLVPFVLTPLNITVIRFAQLGIPVKSTEVPDAVCAVARVSEPPAVSEPVTFPTKFPVMPVVVNVAEVVPLTLIYPCANDASFCSVNEVAIG